MDRAEPDDRTLVEAMRRGDRAGLEGLYRRYADRLYTYARAMLREQEAAADALHDAFLVAGQRIDQLRDPDRLRPWLYAIVRTECLRQLRERSRSSPLDEADEPVADTADPGTGVNADQVRDLVHLATAALNPGDREVVHLAIRHDLSAVDIGAALGVPTNHAHARLSRARSQLERALGALLVARSGARDCPALADLLDGWQGRLTPTLRKRVSRHIDGCASCGLLRREQLNPAALLSAYTAPAFLAVAGPVWSRLAKTGAPADTDGGSADEVDDPADATDVPAGPPDGAGHAAGDDATGGQAGLEPSPAAPPAGPTNPADDGTALEPGPGSGQQPSQESGDEPGKEPLDAPGEASGDGAKAGAAQGASARSGDGPIPALADGPTARPASGAAAPTAAAHPVRPTSDVASRGRRRRRLAATAGLLVVLAVGVWAFGPDRPTAGEAAATSGVPVERSGPPAGGPSLPAVTTPAAGPVARPTSMPGPVGADGPSVTPGTPGTAAGRTGPAAGSAESPAPPRSPAAPEPAASRPTAPRPTAPRPTAGPQLAIAFTVTASAHVRCGQDTYSLVVQATAGAAIGAAQVRWTPAGAATSSQAMTVDGSAARGTVGRLRASTLTWTVRATASDGRTGESPTYRLTNPCVRPG
ncbi:sigma-70 family RNA polymerase sigma factor [Plantactinospora sp. DSM 117369]